MIGRHNIFVKPSNIIDSCILGDDYSVSFFDDLIDSIIKISDISSIISAIINSMEDIK